MCDPAHTPSGPPLLCTAKVSSSVSPGDGRRGALDKVSSGSTNLLRASVLDGSSRRDCAAGSRYFMSPGRKIAAASCFSLRGALCRVALILLCWFVLIVSRLFAQWLLQLTLRARPKLSVSHARRTLKMSSNPEVHFQIIRIALGYSLLGIFVITAFVCVLSFIRMPSKTARPRPLVVIEPPWLRKSLYTSLIVQIVIAAALFGRILLR
jgi:hypothetical protein